MGTLKVVAAGERRRVPTNIKFRHATRRAQTSYGVHLLVTTLYSPHFSIQPFCPTLWGYVGLSTALALIPGKELDGVNSVTRHNSKQVLCICHVLFGARRACPLPPSLPPCLTLSLLSLPSPLSMLTVSPATWIAPHSIHMLANFQACTGSISVGRSCHGR